MQLDPFWPDSLGFEQAVFSLNGGTARDSEPGQSESVSAMQKIPPTPDPPASLAWKNATHVITSAAT